MGKACKTILKLINTHFSSLLLEHPVVKKILRQKCSMMASRFCILIDFTANAFLNHEFTQNLQENCFIPTWKSARSNHKGM